MASESNNIVVELYKCEKLNGDNYDMWSRKIQLVLEEQEATEPLNHVMVELEHDSTAQHRSDFEAYMTWKRKNTIARIMLLSCMDDTVMCKFEQYDTAHVMWMAVKDNFGGTSATKLRKLTIKFDTYKKRPNHTMTQHLREMSNMVRELKLAGHKFIDEQ